MRNPYLPEQEAVKFRCTRVMPQYSRVVTNNPVSCPPQSQTIFMVDRIDEKFFKEWPASGCGFQVQHVAGCHGESHFRKAGGGDRFVLLRCPIIRRQHSDVVCQSTE